MNEKQNGLVRFFLMLDKIIERFVISLLVLMIVIVCTAVFTRKIANFVFPWSEEVTLLCLTWFTFMGIAIGFRERLHIGMDMLEGFCSKRALDIWDRCIDIFIFFFGLYLVVYGWEFSWMMKDSIMAATEIPNMVQYVVIPITGVLTCIYSALQVFGKDVRRYHHIGEEITRDA